MKTYPLRSDKDVIFKYLDTIEGMYNNDIEFDRHDLADYAVAAIIAHKRYGRHKGTAEEIINDLGGIDLWTLEKAGLTYDDYHAMFVRL